MKFLILLILGLGIFDVAFSRGLGQIFNDWYDEVFEESGESSESGCCDILLELFGLDFDDDDSGESGDPVQLPSGPSWVEALHQTLSQTPAGNGPQNPGHQDWPAAEVDQGQRPLPINPFSPEEQGEQPQQVPPISNNSKPIPSTPPAVELLQSSPSGTQILNPSVNPGLFNATGPAEDSLIISIPGDDVDDTDGLGVLEGEERTG